MKKLINIIILLAFIINANAQIQDDLTFNYRSIKSDTMIKCNMLQNKQWALSLNWDTISTSPASLFYALNDIQDSINKYTTDSLKVYNLKFKNCTDKNKYDSIRDTLATKIVALSLIDTILNIKKDSANTALLNYLNLDTTLTLKYDSVQTIVNSHTKNKTKYVKLRNNEPNVTIKKLYNDTVIMYDTLLTNAVNSRTIFNNLRGSNKINITTTNKYVTSTTGQITSNLNNKNAVVLERNKYINLYDKADSLCLLYTSNLSSVKSVVNGFVLEKDSVNNLITIADSINNVSLNFQIYMSNDAVNWNVYDDNFNFSTTARSGNVIFSDAIFTGKYLGLRIKTNSVSRGYIKGLLLTKHNVK